MPVEEFQAYWLRTHPSAVMRLPGVRRYVQSHTRLAGYRKGEPIYDGIAELWFEDTKAMHALRGTKELEAVAADEAHDDGADPHRRARDQGRARAAGRREERRVRDPEARPRGARLPAPLAKDPRAARRADPGDPAVRAEPHALVRLRAGADAGLRRRGDHVVRRHPGHARVGRERAVPAGPGRRAQLHRARRRAVHHHHRARDRPVMRQDARTPVADAVVAASGGDPQATVLGRGRRTSTLLAALANGAQGHALDFDDTHLASIVHGSAPVAPVVLAIAEWHRRPGAAALEAFVAGFEVETRIGRVIGPMLADRGWHVTAVLGHFGAVVAAGKLLGLTAQQLGRALGIAGTQAAGLEQSLGTMCKPLHPGKAAMNGLLAALLAREGFTGPAGILDERPGLPGTFLGVTDLSPTLEDLGKRFEI